MTKRFGFLFSCALLSCFFILILAARNGKQRLIVLPFNDKTVSDSDSVRVKSIRDIERDLERESMLETLADTVAPVLPVIFAKPDSLVKRDSIAMADSLAKRDSLSFAKIRQYIPPYRQTEGYFSPLTNRRPQAFYPNLGNYWRYEAKKDSAGNYRVVEKVGKTEVRYPATATLDEYLLARRETSLANGFRTLSAERMTRRQVQQRGLGFNVQLPGSESGAFSNIFGNNSVDLRINGQANVDLPFTQRRSEDAGIGRRNQFDVTPKMSLRIGVTGTIGDKLRIDINHDTEREFDFENQLKLEYTGYEDEIIKKIIAGNVTLDNRSSLISGARNQFGIRTDLQIGGINLSVVASQQKSKGARKVIKAGAEESVFAVKPYDYEDDKHFFMGYYFRNQWEPSLVNPTIISLQDFTRMDKVEIWKLNTQANNLNVESLRNVIALADLGESKELLRNPYGAASELPNNNAQGEQYSDAFLTDLKTNSALDSTLVKASYESGIFQQLIEGRDYDINRQLGYVTLKSSLESEAALAVAYRYEKKDGAFVEVGDLTGDTGASGSGLQAERLVLKLLRKRAPNYGQTTWPLTMRNIYSVPAARNVSADDFKLNLYYTKPGIEETVKLPGVTFGGNTETLLNATGLDRMDLSNQLRPDDEFDVRGLVFQGSTGRVIFPYLEPFGSRMRKVLSQATFDPGLTIEDAERKFVLDTLYRAPLATIKNISGQDIYQLKGKSKGTKQSTIALGFLLTPGSVSVSSSGNRLTEDVDYNVDYTSGTVQILNPSYLTGDNEITIDYNSEQLTSFEQKSLLGLRADYKFREKLEMGLTAMRLTEKTPVDKYRLGQEPISNFIWGLDGRYTAQPAWLTRAVDALPFIQTKENSQFSVNAEFAQLRPRVPFTADFGYSRNKYRKANEERDFFTDELSGTSYIEDFEGTSNNYSLLSVGQWRTASAPFSTPAIATPANGNREVEITGYRARTAWMGISREIFSNDFNVDIPTDAENPVRPLPIKIIYPDKNIDGLSAAETQARTMNLFFDPKDRGIYNYTTKFERFIDPVERRKNWGGMMQRIPASYTNFNNQNIEFVEFVFRTYGDRDNPNAKLFVDLGTISEDIIPDGKRNTERGLSTTTPIDSKDLIGTQARYGDSSDGTLIKVEEKGNNLTQDLGLDGFSSYDDGIQFPKFKDIYKETGTNRVLSEQRVFADFLNQVNPQNATSLYRTSPEWEALYKSALRDPSADDFGDFRDDGFFQRVYGAASSVPVEKRFMHHFPGVELNSTTAQSTIVGNKGTGTTQYHDTEILNTNAGAAINTENAYYQYEIPLDETSLIRLAKPEEITDYIVAQTNQGITIDGVAAGSWYKVRIPIKRFTRKVGNISDFSQIQTIRVWTSGHENFFTLRFEQFDLVGSQWRVATTLQNSATKDRTRFEVTSIDNVAESKTYQSPPGIVYRRVPNSAGTAYTEGKEQSLQFILDDFSAGDQRAVSKTFNQGINLLRYKNLRMFTHFKGKDINGVDLTQTTDSYYQGKDVRLFVRLGSNEDKDFYEYELPLKPTRGTSVDRDELWQTYQAAGTNRVDFNSLFLKIQDLNALKEQRRKTNGGLDSVYYYRNPEGKPIYNIDGKDARIGVKGNPSLSRITNIVLGVRNYSAGKITETGPLPTGGRDFKSLNIWLDDLRATDYDQEGGYAGLASMSLKLADFATLQANFNTRSSGFGGLDASLSDQQLSETSGFGVTTNINVDKFLPRRAGWNIPVSYSVRRSQGTPKYSPISGDILISALRQEINDNQSLSSEVKLARLDSLNTSIQSVTNSTTLSVPISKRESRSDVLRYLLDPLTFQYNATRNNTESPTAEIEKSQNWSTGLSYRVANLKPVTFKPFFFTKKGALSRFRFNLMPQSITAAAGAGRNWGTTRQRNREGNVPELFKKYPFREQHNFEHKRNFDVQFKPVSFLDLNFGVNTGLQVLERADPFYNVYSKKTNILFETRQDSTGLRRELISRGDSLYAVERLNILSAFSDSRRIKTFLDNAQANTHNQQFSLTFNPQLNRYKSLNFIQLQPITVTTSYRWQNGNTRGGAGGDINNGNSIGNSFQVNPRITWNIREMWKKFPFYRNAEEASKRLGNANNNSNRAPSNQAAENRRILDERERRKSEITRVHREMTEQGFKVPPLDSLMAAEGLDKPLATPQAPKRPSAIKFPTGKDIGRKLILTLGAFRDLSLDFNHNKEAQVSNVLNGYDMFADRKNSYRIPTAFRFGLQDRLTYTVEGRTPIESLDITDSNSKTNRFGARTSLNLSQNLSLNFNSDAEERTQNRITQIRSDALNPREVPSGGVRSSAWVSFSTGSVGEVIFRQIQRFKDDMKLNGNFWKPDTTGKISPLTNQSVSEDFRNAFLVGGNRMNIFGGGLLPLPLPNINLDYQGLAKLPFLKGKVQSATLRSGYSTSYDSDYRNNPLKTKIDTTLAFLGNRIIYTNAEKEINGIKINQRFSPLIGLNLRWANGIMIESSWNRTKSFGFNTVSFNMSNDKTNEASLSFSFSKQGLKLPFQLPFMKSKRLDNTIRFTLTGRFSRTDNVSYNIRKNLEAIMRGNDFDLGSYNRADFNNNIIIADNPRWTQNYNLEPRMSYVFNNKLTADAYLRISRQKANQSLGNNRTITGGAQFRYNISN